MSFKQLETLHPVLARIDELQERVDEAKAAQPDAYDRIMESWAIESTYNSNNIEGSTLSLGDTALLYGGVQVDGLEDDIRQAEGGFAALRFLRSVVPGCAPLSEALIRRVHELAFAEAKDLATRGVYRKVEVEITGTSFQPAPSTYVPERMADLVEICANTNRHPAIVAALFHLEFESIHPFVNANGRTGRLISNYLLMSSGFEPVNIQAESRARYIAAIRAFQEGDDPYPFAAFFCVNLVERQEKVLSLLVAGAADADAQAHSEIGVFLRDSADSSNEMPGGTPSSSDNHAKSSDNGGKSSDNDGKSSDNLSASERKALSHMEGMESVRSSEVADLLGMSQRGAQKLLNRLVDKGLASSFGANRNRRYSVEKEHR